MDGDRVRGGYRQLVPARYALAMGRSDRPGPDRGIGLAGPDAGRGWGPCPPAPRGDDGGAGLCSGNSGHLDAIGRCRGRADRASENRADTGACAGTSGRSEEHTSELQSLMRISYAVFCLKKKKIYNHKLYEKKVTRPTYGIATTIHPQKK